MELQFEKVNVDIKKLEKAGESFIGKLTGTSERPWKEVNRETGAVVEKVIKQYHFTDTQGKNPFIYFGDAGFVNTMLSANIKEGDVIRATKEGMTDLGGGKKVNDYLLEKALLN